MLSKCSSLMLPRAHSAGRSVFASFSGSGARLNWTAAVKNAGLRTNACVEESNYRGARGLDKSVVRALVEIRRQDGDGRGHGTPQQTIDPGFARVHLRADAKTTSQIG